VGRKVHPYGFRLGITKTWLSRWYADRDSDYVRLLHEDIKMRKYIKKKYYYAGIDRIEIERAADRVRVSIHVARPGLLIGRRGAEVENLRQELIEMTGGKQVFINVVEVKTPELCAQLVAENVAQQIERRISFRRAMKRAVAASMAAGAKGIKVACSGRLGGAEIARTEWYREGRVPLSTIRADIDYGFAEAFTTYGVIGVKVWIFRGEIMPAKAEETQEAGEEVQGRA